jgi:hypothetical protein
MGLCLGWCFWTPGFGATELSIGRDVEGRPRLSATAADAEVVILESAPTLSGWQELLRAHGPFADVADMSADGASHAFYRAVVRPLRNDDDWKNLIRGGAGEPFQSEDPGPFRSEPRWVKFAFLLEAPRRIYFQASDRYPFHYDFAVARLPDFEGMTRAEFDSVTLHANGQVAVLGAVLFAPSTNVMEVGIQFVGYDAYPRESIAEWFRAVRAAIQAPEGMEVFYLPTF